MPFATTWMYLESVTLSEVNQAEKEKYHDFGKVMYMLLYLKLITNKDLFIVWHMEFAQCYVPAWMGGGCGGEYMHAKLLQFSSVAQSCLILCDPMDHSTPGFPVHHQPPEFSQTHVH